jgi:hypothetical protein
VGLYLCIFDGDEELDGVEVGSYADWGVFVDKVVELREGGERGSRHPTLTLHHDSDGEWSVAECRVLLSDLAEIGAVFRNQGPDPPTDGWQAQAAKQFGVRFATLYDCFIDVDGENVIERLEGLAGRAIEANRPILFQ